MSTPHGTYARWSFLLPLTAAIVALTMQTHEALSAAPGQPDPSFGEGGRVITQLSPGSNLARAMAIQSDGRIIVAGRDYQGGFDFPDIVLVRYNHDGTLDASFGAGGIVRTDFDNWTDEADEVIVQPDGRIVVVGTSSSGSPNFEVLTVLVRYNPDGSLDSTFGVGGAIRTDFPSSPSGLLLQTDGAIVVAGVSRGDTTFSDFGLTRYTADGSLDTSFGVDGRVSTDIRGVDSVAAIALDGEGRIVAVGSTFTLARYLPNGTLDPGFGTGGIAITPIHNDSGWSFDLAIQADGKIVAVGTAGVFNGPDFYLVRYTADGSLDSTFDGDGKVITDFPRTDSRVSVDQAHAVAIDSVGRIILGGSAFGAEGNSYDFALARYNADGSLDASFGTDGRMTTHFGDFDDIVAVELQRDGKIVAAGHASVRVTSDFALARYDGGIPHASPFFLHASDAPPATADLVMRAAPPDAQPLTTDAPSVTWLSDPPVNGMYPAGAEFRFVTPCTRTSSAGKTVRLASTDLDGGNERLLGTAQSAPTCGRTEAIIIPVTTPVTLTNRRLKLTVAAGSGGLHLQLGPRTFVTATAFEGAQP